jgi:aspartate aminotransferase
MELFADFGPTTPEGAFYLMLPLAPGSDSRASALDLVGHGVAVAPGTAFGSVAADHVRLSLASPDDVLRRGAERLSSWREATGGEVHDAVRAPVVTTR